MVRVILEKLGEHLLLTLISLFLALLIALPLALYLTRGRSPRLSVWTLRISALIQTVPGLAMITFIVIVLAQLNAFLSLPATGMLPGAIAITIYAIMPILSNTYTGVKQVDPTLLEVAQGMGMTSRQILFWVELPLALPFIMVGIRIATVWIIGLATLASLVGAGGLGDLILQGLRSMQINLLLAGTIPAALLALFFDWALMRIERWIRGSRLEA